MHLEAAGVSFGHGTDNAWDEAAWLALHALGLPVNETADLHMDIDLDARQKIDDLIEQRITTRKPAAYLTGTAWFAGLPFAIREGVIVPRSHIARFLLDGGRPWTRPERVSHVLDLCTGSGCIAVAAALAFPNARVDACDIDDRALQLARENVMHHGLESRIEIIKSDLYRHTARQYDLILSNPPYVPSADVDDLPEEYRHEPRQAFDGGRDGLKLVHRILSGAVEHLRDEGLLVVEVGETWTALQAAYPGMPFTWLEADIEDAGLFLLSRQQLTDFYS